MKKLILFWILCLCFIHSKAQEKPIYNYFLLNPYAYNPAYAGYEYRPVLFLTYRQQWASVEGAPTTSTAIFHTPVSETIGLGASIYNDRRSILSTTNLMFSFAYKMRFDLDHFISMGLSAGVGFNTITNLDEILNDPRYANDPAILNAIDNTIYLDGQFGINYHVKGLNIGATLPRLFDSEVIQAEEFNQGKLDPLNAYQFIVSYRPHVKDKVTFEPTVAYRMQSDNFQTYFEAGGLLNLRNAIWIGGSYRQNYGVSTLINLNFRDKLHVAYSYDIAAGPSTGFIGSTHEFSLRLNLGEEKRPEKRERQKAEEETDPYEEYLNRKDKPVDKPVERNDLLGNNGEVTNYSGPEEVVKGNHLLELDQGYYVIVGVFNSYEKSENYSDWLFEQGFYTRYGYSSQTSYYYVYIYYSLSDATAAEQEKARINEKSMFNNAWVLTVK